MAILQTKFAVAGLAGWTAQYQTPLSADELRSIFAPDCKAFALIMKAARRLWQKIWPNVRVPKVCETNKVRTIIWLLDSAHQACVPFKLQPEKNTSTWGERFCHFVTL